MGNETLTTRVNPDEITAIPVPVGISARHIHLSQEHVDILFGPGYELKNTKIFPNQVSMLVRKH